ncbi:MAG: SRPBCC domain-containing protein [Myxococcales bacterium]|nr:SRPBCC domain-containing protein [Myxococcales bacterium]
MNRVTFVIALAGLVTSCSCTTVRQLKEPATLPVDGKASRTRAEKALDYSIAIDIAAKPEVVWAVLTDAPSFKTWNTTIVSLEGTIAKDQAIKLVSKVAPDRTFDLKVTTFDAPTHMVWEDGNGMFLGVRHFTLTAKDGGTVLAMSETYSGGMLGMIEGKLPDMTANFETFAANVKTEAERRASTP